MALKVIYDNFADQTCVKVHYEVGFLYIYFFKLRKTRRSLGFSKELKKQVLSEYLIWLMRSHWVGRVCFWSISKSENCSFNVFDIYILE